MKQPDFNSEKPVITMISGSNPLVGGYSSLAAKIGHSVLGGRFKPSLNNAIKVRPFIRYCFTEQVKQVFGFCVFLSLSLGTWISISAGIHQVPPLSGRSDLRPGDLRILILCISIPAISFDLIGMILLQSCQIGNLTRVTQPELTLL